MCRSRRMPWVFKFRAIDNMNALVPWVIIGGCCYMVAVQHHETDDQYPGVIRYMHSALMTFYATSRVCDRMSCQFARVNQTARMEHSFFFSISKTSRNTRVVQTSCTQQSSMSYAPYNNIKFAVAFCRLGLSASALSYYFINPTPHLPPFLKIGSVK